MCLRAACRYNPQDQKLTLHNGLQLTKAQLGKYGNNRFFTIDMLCL